MTLRWTLSSRSATIFAGSAAKYPISARFDRPQLPDQVDVHQLGIYELRQIAGRYQRVVRALLTIWVQAQALRRSIADSPGRRFSRQELSLLEAIREFADLAIELAAENPSYRG